MWRVIGQEGQNSVGCPLNNIATRPESASSVELAIGNRASSRHQRTFAL